MSIDQRRSLLSPKEKVEANSRAIVASLGVVFARDLLLPKDETKLKTVARPQRGGDRFSFS